MEASDTATLVAANDLVLAAIMTNHHVS